MSPDVSSRRRSTARWSRHLRRPMASARCLMLGTRAAGLRRFGPESSRRPADVIRHMLPPPLSAHSGRSCSPQMRPNCPCHSNGNPFSRSSSCSPAGCRPSRIASTISGASSVSRKYPAHGRPSHTLAGASSSIDPFTRSSSCFRTEQPRRALFLHARRSPRSVRRSRLARRGAAEGPRAGRAVAGRGGGPRSGGRRHRRRAARMRRPPMPGTRGAGGRAG